MYSISGGAYSDGYASGHAGFDGNKMNAALDTIFHGNDQKNASYSVGGATVRTYTLPNGRRIAMLTDTFDFNHDIDTTYNPSKPWYSSGNLTTTLGNAMAKPASKTMYAIYEDDTPASKEDMEILDKYWKEEWAKRKEKNPNLKAKNLAKYAKNLGDLMYTKWTGKGNVYKSQSGGKILNYLMFFQ